MRHPTTPSPRPRRTLPRRPLKWLAPLTLLLACTAAEDGYRVESIEQDGTACVTALGYAALEPGRPTTGVTARQLSFDVRFDCGEPVHILGLTCPECAVPDKVEIKGMVRLVRPQPIPVGKEAALDQTPQWLHWRTADGRLTGSLALRLTYDPAEEAEGCQ